MAEETTKAAEVTSNEEGANGLAARLESMEKLLARQAESSQKIARSRNLMVLLMLCLVVVFAVGWFALNATVSNAVSELPELMDAANTALQEINKIDVDALNGAIGELDSGLGQMDFEALNSGIQDFQTAAEGLANFMSIFSR